MRILIDNAGVITEREVTPAQAEIMGKIRLLRAKERAGRFKLSVWLFLGKVSEYRLDFPDGGYREVYLRWF
jgi:hypothetical protein